MKPFLSSFFHSIRARILLLFAVIMVLLIGLMLWFTGIREASLVERVAQANQGLLRYHAGIMEQELTSAEQFFTEQKLMQSNYLAAETADSELDLYLISHEIRNTLEYALYETEILDAIFFYSPNKEHLIYYGSNQDHLTEADFHRALPEIYPAVTAAPGKWVTQKLCGQNYLFYMIQIHNSWIGGLINTDRLIAAIDLKETDALQEAFLLDRDFQPISGRLEEAEASGLSSDIANANEKIRFGGHSYMGSLIPVRQDDYYLLGLTDDTVLFQKKRAESTVLVIGVFLLALFTFLMIQLLWRLLVRPLSNITEGMNRLQKGDFSYQLPEETSGEFAQITSTFNSMSKNIETLKIAVYEEQLEHQKTELQFLQSQLDPHFLINCINNLRTVALQGNEELFQTMLIDIGTYLRGNMTMQQLVPLETEINNVRAYVQLQQIRYQNRIHLEIEIYEELLLILVPVHIVQTFVENSVKYCLSSENEVLIRIRGDLSEELDDLLEILILDDGPGFAPEILQQLKEQQPVMKADRECIGIVNAAMRLKLLLGECAQIVCSNQGSGGASVKLQIPVKGEDYESTDS